MSANKNTTTPIYYNANGFYQLNQFLEKSDYSKIFVLIDNHTQIFCLPTLKEKIAHTFTFIPIRFGEKQKNIKTTQFLWQELTELGADRNSILINLGGGVISDMGGFAASTFKRGIRFINIPTTLLGMVDAAIGGKTGVDHNGLKNQIGLFSNPEMILIYPDFLETLPTRELKSGLAEIIKYGLIDKNNIWEYLKKMDSDTINIDDAIIKESASLKERIITEDPFEKGIRKALNFGHTLGHAIETYFLTKLKKKQLLHGEAIAIGMILAAYLSSQTQGLSIESTNEITQLITSIYPKVHYLEFDNASIIELLKHDKKNNSGQINFVLLEAIGKPVLDCQVSEAQISDAFDYYHFFK